MLPTCELLFFFSWPMVCLTCYQADICSVCCAAFFFFFHFSCLPPAIGKKSHLNWKKEFSFINVMLHWMTEFIHVVNFVIRFELWNIFLLGGLIPRLRFIFTCFFLSSFFFNRYVCGEECKESVVKYFPVSDRIKILLNFFFRLKMIAV